MTDIRDRYEAIEACYYDVVRYLWKFGFDEDTFKDAVQETFVEAFSRATTLRDMDKARNWVIKIAKYTGLKYKRKKNSSQALECEFTEDVVQLSYRNTYEKDILKSVIEKEDSELLCESMGKLKDKERDTLVHQYIYEEKLKDIAPKINESLTNTKTISKRSKEKLKKLLLEGGYENGK